MRNLNRIQAYTNRQAAMQDLARVMNEAIDHGFTRAQCDTICANLRAKYPEVSAAEIDKYISRIRHLWGAGYKPSNLIGRCRSGIDTGGTVIHAVPCYYYQGDTEGISIYGVAACGVHPGPRSNGWSQYDTDRPLDVVTCPKCKRILADILSIIK